MVGYLYYNSYFRLVLYLLLYIQKPIALKVVVSKSHKTASGDIPFLDSHSPFFFIKNGLKLLKERALEMTPKCGRAETRSWP